MQPEAQGSRRRRHVRERRVQVLVLDDGLAWANQNVGAGSASRPPEKNEVVLSINLGCADTVFFSQNPNAPF